MIDKHIMIEVLIAQNNNLEKQVKLQEAQIEAYSKQVENYRDRVEKYEETETIRIKLEDAVRVLVKSYEDQIQRLENIVEVHDTCINGLNARVEELQAYAPNNDPAA